MEQTELSINFQPANKGAKDQGTTPRFTVDGKLSVDIKFDAAIADDILWHEGAHVYLFHLAYPPIWPTKISEPLGPPLDVVNEYLATKLEIDRRYRTKEERTAVLRERLGRALMPLPIRPHEAHPGSGRFAVAAAIYGAVAKQWTTTLTHEASEHLARAPAKLNAMYWSAVDAIRQAPAIPFGSSRLTNESVETIKLLISASFNKVYGGAYTIRFTP